MRELKGLVVAAIAGIAMSVYAGYQVLCSNCKGKGWFQTRCVYWIGTGQVVCSVCNGRGGAWGLQAASLFLAVASTGNGYVGIVPEPALAMI